MNCTIYVFPSCYLPSRYKANNVANFPRPPNHRCALLPPGIDFVQRFPCQARRSALRNLPLGNGLYSFCMGIFDEDGEEAYVHNVLSKSLTNPIARAMFMGMYAASFLASAGPV